MFSYRSSCRNGMKKMAAHLFFLYSVERGQAEKDGKDVVEDFFYAGENMYRFAVVEQISSEDDEDEYEEEDWEEDTDDDNKD